MRDVLARFVPTQELKLDESAQHYAFELYITGTLPKSNRALRELKTTCERLLKGRYSLKVIDLLKEPARAARRVVPPGPPLRALPVVDHRGFVAHRARARTAFTPMFHVKPPHFRAVPPRFTAHA